MKNIILTIIFLSSTLLFSQTTESEPNDLCTDTGIKTISSHGNLFGDLGGHSGDNIDYWFLQFGSSGTVTFYLSLDAGTDSYLDVICYAGGYCNGTPISSQTVLNESSENISLNSANYYVLRMVGNDFDPTGYTITISGGVLPVELTSFSANITNNNIQLMWETATEVNNYGFEVERQYSDASTSLNMSIIPSSLPASGVGDEGWEKISFVEGHGNSNSPKYYSYIDKSIESSGKYSYRLKQVDIDGTFEYSDQIEADLGLPQYFELKQNYPNPFNPTTSVSFSIPSDGLVSLTIYDVLGNEIEQLENGVKSAGNYSYSFDASDLTSGIYFYTIRSGKFVETKKMLLMK